MHKGTTIKINAETLPPLETFPYLGRIIGDITKPAKSSKALRNGRAGTGKDGRNGVGPWRDVYGGGMYMAHLVFLYGRNIWVVTVDIANVLEGFHYWAVRRITGAT